VSTDGLLAHPTATFSKVITIRCLLYLFLFIFFADTLTSDDIRYGVTSGFKFPLTKSASSKLNLQVSKPSTRQELFSDWSILLTFLDMIGRLKMNESLHDMTPKRDVVRCQCIVKGEKWRKKETT